MNKIKNLSKKSILSVVAFLFLLVGGTFAWWNWSSEINALVNGRVCAPEIVFLGGSTINGTDIMPTVDKENGLKKDISVNLENLCDNDTAVLNLNMTLESFPSSLSDSSFKWVLYGVTSQEVNEEIVETETFVNSGNFANKAQNDTITLAEDLIVTSNVSTYRLYIWIDGTMDNPSSMGGNAFRFKLYGTGTGAIYNQYTMAQKSNSSATAAFWGSPIKANQVKSIRFVKASEVPNQYTGTYDVSSVANSQDVTMYYVENGQTEDATPITLYDVYVASNNGASKIKTNTSAQRMFANLTNCEYIDAEGLDTSNATSMSRMFDSSGKLSTLKISNWDTPIVTDMSYMFNNCKSLTTLDLSSFNTSNVTTMVGMFLYCSGLTGLDLSNFNTPELAYISANNGSYGMFRGCSNLEYLYVNNFNTSKVSDMRAVFKDCSKLKSLDLSNWDTSNVAYINGNMVSMFYGCGVEYLDVSNFSFDKLTNISSLFSGLKKLKEIKLNNVKTNNIINMEMLFDGCTSLTSLDLSSFNTSNVTSMERMFRNCYALTSIDLSSFNTSNVESMYWMFANCSSLTELDLSHFNTDSLTTVSSSSDNRYGMFSGCTKLEKLNLSSFDFAKITNIRALFYNCNKLKEINLSGADFSNITDVTNTFEYVSADVKIYIDCRQQSKFVELFGSKSGLTTVNNEYCSS